MKNLIKNMPLAISGLLLAILSLGNLYDNLIIKYLLFIIGSSIILLLLSKLILFKDILKNELNQLVILSTSGTFSMALMLWSTYILTFNRTIALLIWLIGIILHILLIITFTYKYILNNFNIENVYGSYWIVYVGITMASITGLSFNLQNYTWIFCMFGFLVMFPTFLVVTYRYIKYPLKDEQNKPLICIYAALFNILIVGYLNSFSNININFLLILYGIATTCYMFSLYEVINYRHLPFYPSFSAFTFPFVISAIASTKIFELFSNSILNYVAGIEIIVASLLVIYVFLRYTKNILLKNK